MNPESARAFLAGLSDEARTVLEPMLRQPGPPPPPAPHEQAAWQRLQAEIDKRSSVACEHALAAFEPELDQAVYGGMDSVIVRPALRREDAAPLVFLHGGGYTGFSARSSLFASVPLAAETGRTVISLDYPLAPASTFEHTVPAAAGALAAVLEDYPRASLAGDSAGGGLALAAVNRLLRDNGPAPSALVLISPWADLADRGDSRITLRDHDPILCYDPALAACAAAYAPGALDDPAASPVLAEYDSTFPPTLLLCGTRDILLSDSIHLSHRLRAAGVRATLRLYDGLHHSFPVVTPLTPEARKARADILAFLRTVDRADRNPAGGDPE